MRCVLVLLLLLLCAGGSHAQCVLQNCPINYNVSLPFTLVNVVYRGYTMWAPDSTPRFVAPNESVADAALAQSGLRALKTYSVASGTYTTTAAPLAEIDPATNQVVASFHRVLKFSGGANLAAGMQKQFGFCDTAYQSLQTPVGFVVQQLKPAGVWAQTDAEAYASCNPDYQTCELLPASLTDKSGKYYAQSFVVTAPLPSDPALSNNIYGPTRQCGNGNMQLSVAGEPTFTQIKSVDDPGSCGTALVCPAASGPAYDSSAPGTDPTG